MKRHPQLTGLSREHYGALKLARDAKHAAESGNIEQVIQLSRRIVDSFARELDSHFRNEEAGILPFLAKSGRNDLVRQALSDHAQLRALVIALHSPEASILLQFADRMTTHVRFEERELFETAQSLLATTGQTTFFQDQEP